MKIEKAIPTPHKSTGRGRPPRYPFSQMEVGDSILVDGEAAGANGCSAYSAAMQYGRRNGKKFTGRKTGEGKVRIWRIE